MLPVQVLCMSGVEVLLRSGLEYKGDPYAFPTGTSWTLGKVFLRVHWSHESLDVIAMTSRWESAGNSAERFYLVLSLRDDIEGPPSINKKFLHFLCTYARQDSMMTPCNKRFCTLVFTCQTVASGSIDDTEGQILWWLKRKYAGTNYGPYSGPPMPHESVYPDHNSWGIFCVCVCTIGLWQSAWAVRGLGFRVSARGLGFRVSARGCEFKWASSSEKWRRVLRLLRSQTDYNWEHWHFTTD